MGNEQALGYEFQSSGDEAQFLTFKLNNLDYGISIKKVQEIRRWAKVTPLPNTPDYIRGVLNLRGAIVPIIDLRLRFGMEETEYDAFTVIVVVNIAGRMAGIVVDAVSDVLAVNPDEQREAPDIEGQINRQYIAGLAQTNQNLLILLDVDKLVNPEALDAVADDDSSCDDLT